VLFINYIPIATTLFCLYFLIVLYRHWSTHRKTLYVFWWMLGVFFYGAGTVTEAINTLYGYSPENFKAWYIFGALLGGAPLAQGTVYLIMKRRTANVLSIILLTVIIVATVLVILSPLYPVPEGHVRLSGKLLQWKFIRYITPFINLYAFAFLVGGAVYSAFLYAQDKHFRDRFWGNVFIAIGGLLPGIGGSFTKFGFVEVLYVTEFIGILFIYAGYYVIKTGAAASLHVNQQGVESTLHS
jgi:hypothetical protein